MKYKPGDEVFIKAEITDVSDCSERPYFVAPDCRSINWVSEDKFIPMGKTYEMGLNDAWELLHKVYDMECDVIEEIFGVSGCFYDVIKNFTYEDCRDKIEAYEREKEIKVGSIVTGISGAKGVVTRVCGRNSFYVMWSDGSCGAPSKEDLKSAGKIAESLTDLLRQIGE